MRHWSGPASSILLTSCVSIGAVLDNLSGSVVLLSLAAASVQVFTLVTPDRGLLHVLFGTFFFVQLLSTLAGTSDRRALLRSLTVLLGSAFVLRYIVLESLYARSGGALTRMLTALMEGVSLGACNTSRPGRRPATWRSSHWLST